MSGLEVAGLVLGAIPLLLMTARGINDELGRMHDWWDFEATFDNLLFVIEAQKSLYRQNLRLLVEPLSLPEAEIEALLEGTSLEVWNQANVQSSLRARFDEEDYTFMTRRLRAMHQSVVALQALLPLDELYGPNTIKAEFKRAVVSFTSDANKRIARIASINHELNTFLKNERQIVKSRQRKKLYFPLDQVQSHAVLYHQRLRECWSCSCQPTHSVGITLHHEKNERFPNRSRNHVHTILEHDTDKAYFVVKSDPSRQVSTQTVEQRGTLGAWDLALREKAQYGTTKYPDDQEHPYTQNGQAKDPGAAIVATHRPDKSHHSLKVKFIEATKTMWQSTTSRSRSSRRKKQGNSPQELILENKSNELAAETISNAPPLTLGRPTINSSPLAVQNRVRFADAEEQKDDCDEHIVHAPNEVVVIDACSIKGTLGQYKPDQVLIHLGQPSDNKVNLMPKIPPKTYQDRTQSIHEYLRQMDARCFRMELGLRLTLTLLSFITTPWLMGRLSQRDLFVLMQRNPYDLDEWSGPYISFQPGDSPTDTQTPAQPWPVKQTVLLLGVMLLELFHGQPIENTPIWASNTVQGKPVGSTLFYSANQWLASSAGGFTTHFGPDIGKSITDAISKCIRFRFDSESAADEATLAQVLYREIFTPMEEGVPRNRHDD
ncbi:uncharacterized protein F5Z01DRAFT_82734 [Emericellopsis atlantica]|uniref:DUF7580 domain-containing protein n=1 Tax=Emericellopsis atlantica TaxID=2614577 RepID=A0A9P7ZMF3_9HYPO|nr:uncharacterized protein F5Z01DRAFT_82734 [Emericellopsis atlantica]KAG9254621.1 hypothetical protein F5Z01DRAFT_82734 [Emericellopsis atlantica]